MYKLTTMAQEADAQSCGGSSALTYGLNFGAPSSLTVSSTWAPGLPQSLSKKHLLGWKAGNSGNTTAQHCHRKNKGRVKAARLISLSMSHEMLYSLRGKYSNFPRYGTLSDLGRILNIHTTDSLLCKPIKKNKTL